jgi:hypothetical protein
LGSDSRVRGPLELELDARIGALSALGSGGLLIRTALDRG